MTKPKPSYCDTGDGTGVDWECYEEAMGDYMDSERDREIEEKFEREEEKENKND